MAVAPYGRGYGVRSSVRDDPAMPSLRMSGGRWPNGVRALRQIDMGQQNLSCVVPRIALYVLSQLALTKTPPRW